MKTIPALSPQELRRTIDPQLLNVAASGPITPHAGIVGQQRAVAALRFGLSIRNAGLPLKQGTAVTGSVNQHGEVQAIGGINQKIEGFFEICLAQGLTSEQGVLIPRSNIQNLMLREDVVKAVREGQFHIWAVATIGEGIDLRRVVTIDQPTVRITYDLVEQTKPDLREILAGVIERVVP